MAGPAENGREPVSEINTTPLIDVLLVLLIMFIITIPIQTHAVKLDVPTGPPADLNPVKNKLVVMADDSILWNGKPVDLAKLRAYLALSQRMDPVPELHLQPHAKARYEVVDQVLAVSKQAAVKKMGFVGNEAYTRW